MRSTLADPPAARIERHGATIVFVTLLVGLLAWIAVMGMSRKAREGMVGPICAVGVAAALTLVPAVRNGVALLVDRMRDPSLGARWKIGVVIAITSSLYLLFTAVHQGRDLNAKEQDESMYLIQAQMLARGHLSMPAHPHGEFFESYHVFARPRYAAIYFPGTALVYAPAVLVGLPPWVISLAIAGAAVGMTYRVIAEMIDGAAGVLAALLLLGNVMFRHLSTMVMSHTVMLLIGLLMVWAWMRWREKHALRFAIGLGLLSGLAAITRPVDAVCFAAAIGAVAAWEWFKGQRDEARVRRSMLSSILIIVLAASPFLLLQLIFDFQLTGRWLRTPVTEYHDQYWPQVKIGARGEGDEAYHAPPTVVPQFRDYYERYILDAYRAYRRTNPVRLALASRTPLLLDVAVPFSLLLVFVPLGAWAIFRVRNESLATGAVGHGGQARRLNEFRSGIVVMALPIVLFVIGYAPFMFFRKHYGVVVFPGIYLLILLGMELLRRSFSTARAGVACFCALMVVGLVAALIPEINRSVRDQISPTPILHDFQTMVAGLPHKPAVVFVKYDPADRNSWSEEPVYNTDVAWPDDAAVVRAHDLGAKNAELIAYYAARSPARWVYLYDKSARTLVSLGKAEELARGRAIPQGTR
jgi:hypothetical protein